MIAVLDSLRITQCVGGVDAKIAPVLPRLRISNANVEPTELGERDSPAGGRQPRRARRVLAERRGHIRDDAAYSRLLGGREVALGVKLPDGVGHGRLRDR